LPRAGTARGRRGVVVGTAERLATGDAVNVAARLGGATHDLVRGAVDVVALQPLELKGKAAMRPWRPSSGNAPRISPAARKARRASSSRTDGTPNTAITASPMNFSTDPPCDSTIPFIRSK